LRREVNQAFDRLAARYNPVVMEGAGSISEINLKDTDLVNLPMARHAHADVILVADIDRGGVFASAYGSVALQTPEDRKRIKGIIVNKFRGDLRLFESGVKMMEEICGIPVLGVIPYYHDIYIEEEDSVELSLKQRKAVQGKVNVAVVLLRHLSNFTDFNMLEHDERVNLYYTNNVDDLMKADIILLPGSKSTIDDLYELRRNGVAQAILQARRNGATVMGICGGYQMMGQRIADPDGVEGSISQMPGLGLLPTETVIEGEKVTRQVRFAFLSSEEPNCTGYEIHMGRTSAVEGETLTPLVRLENGETDGCVVDRKCAGSYIHGILDNPEVIEWLLAPYAEKLEQPQLDYTAFKEEQYNKLADHVRKHLNMPLLYQILTQND
jgi:adenosylcobyric acid synthase